MVCSTEVSANTAMSSLLILFLKSIALQRPPFSVPSLPVPKYSTFGCFGSNSPSLETIDVVTLEKSCSFAPSPSLAGTLKTKISSAKEHWEGITWRAWAVSTWNVLEVPGVSLAIKKPYASAINITFSPAAKKSLWSKQHLQHQAMNWMVTWEQSGGLSPSVCKLCPMHHQRASWHPELSSHAGKPFLSCT